jgi:hypothetical protein
VNDHPVQLVVTDDLHRSRLTVAFRLLLAIPHIVWVVLWTIGVFFLSFVAWIVALFRAQLPKGLHDFFAMYIRYVTHLGAYMTIAANPYPGFTGTPGYPVDVELPADPQRQNRWTIAFRLFLALPALVLASVLGWGAGGGGGGGTTGDEPGGTWWATGTFGGVATVCGFLGWFAALALGRMPLGIRNLGAYGLGYAARAYAYGLLVTDRYPNADPDSVGPAWDVPPHPVRLELSDDGRRSRLTVFFRLLLTMPHLVWLVLWSLAAFFAALANGIVALVRGRSAESLHRFLRAYIRYYAHVNAFLFLIANPFPGFTGTPGYPVEVSIGEAERQNRWVTLFRIFLGIPALFLAGALSIVLFVVSFFGWFFALATGRMPGGFRNAGAMAIRYLAQTNAYWFVVTDTYPHASPGLHEPERDEQLELPYAPEPEVAA